MRFQRVPLLELEQLCGREGCGHQGAVHTGGAKPWGWAVFDPTWANATGWCQTPGSECAGRMPARVNREAA